MTLSRDDVIDVLTACAALDHRRIGESDIDAWSATLRPDLTRPLCLAAVAAHYMASTDRAMPAHINTLAVGIRRDRAEREKAAEVHQAAIAPPNPALGGLPIPTAGTPVHGAYRVNDAITRACPRCNAEPNRPCVTDSAGRESTIPCLQRLTGKAHL